MNKKIKKSLKIFLWTLTVLFALFVVFIIISCIGSDSNARYIESHFSAVGDGAKNYTFNEETGYYEFIVPSDREFSVLQLTDLHLGGGVFCEGKDIQALNAVYKTVAGTKPDLIIFTGDVLYPMPLQSGNINNMKTAKQFASFMEKLKVPYTLIYGNHDTEFYTFADRKKLSDYFASDKLEYSVFTQNPKNAEVDGYGNQIITLRNEDTSLNTAMVLFDSHANINGNLFKYDSVHENQINWYSSSIRALSTAENGFKDGETVQSLMFTHIPLNEFQDAWDAHKSGSPDAEYLWGVKDENILAPTVDKKTPKSTLFDEVLLLGSTKAVFCGHNHKNNFAINYKGVLLNFSKSIVYLGLSGIHKTDYYRGGTVINIKTDRSFIVQSVGINNF